MGIDSPTDEPATALGSLLRSVTVEHALYAMGLVMAAGLRFHDLAAAPLGPLEAASAFSAWNAANGPAGPALATERPPTSALLFGIQWLLFWFTPGGDIEARVMSAAAGSALVLAPWLLRGVIGRGGALALAALLAIDPVLVGLSRTADGAIFSALWALLTIAGLAQPVHDTLAARRWRSATGACAGLLLVSGKEAWSLLALVAAAVVLVPRFLPVHARVFESGDGRSFIATGALTAFVAATTGLVQWQGATFVATGLTAWMEQWRFDGAAASSAGALVVGLVTAQPLLVALPLVGFVLSWPRSHRRSATVCGVVLVAGVIGAGIAGGAGAVRLTLTLTLALLAACSVRTIAHQWSVPGYRLPGVRVLGAVTGAGLFLLTLRAALQAVVPGAADEGVRKLAQDVAALSVWRAGDADAVPIAVVADPWPDPLLAWYLRDHSRLRWILSAPLEAPDSAVGSMIITPDARSGTAPLATQPSAPRGYTGTRYRIGRPAAEEHAVVLWVTRP